MDTFGRMNIDQQALAEMFAITTIQQPEDSIGFLLWRVAHRHQREIDRACAAVDLTHLQFVTLVLSAWLSRSGQPVTQPGLAKFSNIDPMQLSNVLKALEKKALVARPRSESDIRMKRVEVTPTGIEVLSRALPLAAEAQKRFFGPDLELGERLHSALRQIVASWGEDR